ncbi:MAG: adenylate/guanylate cyclase domain-containing protein [Terracidiphilus sp.]|jgi:class 3 adenylate cyclase
MTSSDESAMLSALMRLVGPSPPSKLTPQYKDQAFERIMRRSGSLSERVESSTIGRVIPDVEQLAIGEGKHFENLSVLFLDMCSFSDLSSWTTQDQKLVLKTLNIFMGEMLNVVRDFGGVFEKNTGDGLMAYFGEGSRTLAEAAKPAVEAAVAMHYVNDEFIGFFLSKHGCQRVNFRVGVDTGPITLARVAVHGGTHGGIVAIGAIANVACKLMRLIPNGGICIGERTYEALPNNWKQTCEKLEGSTGHVYLSSRTPYPGWRLDYRARDIPWAS